MPGFNPLGSFISYPLLFLVISKVLSWVSDNNWFLKAIKDSCASSNPSPKLPSSFKSLSFWPLNLPASVDSLELFISVYTNLPSSNIGSLLASTNNNFMFSKDSSFSSFFNRSAAYWKLVGSSYLPLDCALCIS